jgi:peptidoglycan/LPS O-acetylase OafA/YrhL
MAQGDSVTRIPSLDGLRAVSISMVLIGHASYGYDGRYKSALSYLGNGDLGVSVFFIISGFLITTLLLKEFDRTGDISLKYFYLRRAFRILPPFYAFMLGVLIAWHFGWITSEWRSWMSALLFVRDYFLAGDWWTIHIWSLSVEEQFYLLWPVLLVSLGRRRGLNLALVLIAISPLIRVITHKFWNHGWQDSFMFHTRMDGLMMGCALAIVHKELWFLRVWKRIESGVIVVCALALPLLISPMLARHFLGYYRLPFGYTFDSLAISYLLVYFIRNADSAGGRILNWKPITHLGVLSYSLYLWQQLFFGTKTGSHILGMVCAVVCAEISWHLIEKPSFVFRDWLMRKPVNKTMISTQYS